MADSNSDYDYAKYSLQRVENNINIVRTHSKWLISLLAVVALGSASFIFKDLGELPIIYKDEEESAQFVRLFAGTLFLVYSIFIIAFVPILLWGIKVLDHNEEEFIGLNENQKTKIIKSKINENAKKLFTIDKRFKTLMLLSALSPFVVAMVSASLTYL